MPGKKQQRKKIIEKYDKLLQRKALNTPFATEDCLFGVPGAPPMPLEVIIILTGSRQTVLRIV